jgi:hypothetical protein
MKTNSIARSLCTFLYSIFVISCITKQPEAQGVENPACGNGLVSRYTRKETTGQNYVYENNYEYMFDSENRITRIKMTMGGSHYSGLIEINTFTYDSEGYLTSRISSLENLQANSDTYDIKDEYYTYANGRLVKTTGVIKSYTKNGSRGTYPINDSYEYNSKGSLIRRSDAYDRTWIYEYDANDMLSGYSEIRQGSSSVNAYSFTNGLVSVKRVQYGNVTYENRYTYDSERQLTEDRQFRNDEPYGTTSYTYDNQNMAVILDGEQWFVAPIAFKGHPAIPSLFGVRKHNQVSQNYNGVKSQEYTLSYNAEGYPTQINSRMNIDRYTGKSDNAETIIEYCK